MEIRIKRAYTDAAPDDGARVLVDRLWPRGISREQARLALWLKEIAPSTELRRWFHHEGGDWEGFRARYLQELTANPDAVQRLDALAAQGPVTLVYGSRDEEQNGAVVIREYLEGWMQGRE